MPRSHGRSNSYPSVFPIGPHAAFRSGSLIVRETVYGIVKRLRFFLSRIEAERSMRSLQPAQVRVLDVGCGTGVNMTIPLANMKYSILGLDADSSSIAQAQKLSKGLTNLQFISGTLENRTFPEPFHVVICSEVLEHLANPAKLLTEIRKNLCGGGLLLLSVPNGFGYFEIETPLWRIVNGNRLLRQTLYSMEYRFWKRFGSPELLARRTVEYDPTRYSVTQSTLSGNQSHFQSFTLARLIRLLSARGFIVFESQNTTVFAGNLVGLLARELDPFLRWNSKAADRLPAFAASGWLVAARRD